MRASRANIFFGAARATITFHTGSTRHFCFLSVAITIAPRLTSCRSPVTATIKASGAGATNSRSRRCTFSFGAIRAACRTILVGEGIYSAPLTICRIVMLGSISCVIFKIFPVWTILTKYMIFAFSGQVRIVFTGWTY